MLLHVITSMLTGGAEKLVSELLPRFKVAGIDCGLALLDAEPTPFLQVIEDAGIEIFALGHRRGSMYDPRAIARLRPLMARASIVHTHNTSPQFFAAAAWRKGGPKMVTTEHSTNNRRRRIPGFKALDRAMYSRYDSIVCCSQPVHDTLTAYLGKTMPAEHITVINNGVNLAPYLAITPRKPAETTEILMVSAFRPEKDHLTAMRALALLPDCFRLTFAGDGALRQQTMQEAERMGLAGRVTFTGNVADVPALYRKADISLLSTSHEGMSLSIIEAMASGVPLVASDVDGVRDNVGDGAILVPGADAKALADTLSMLARSESLRTETGRRGRENALKYDIENTTQKYITLYNTLHSTTYR